ncbi:hypothetical protein CYCD_22050 [Tenuifilaceae bacterium CYCD]|nr:hypothetical protein CYCD_22050 [Tenuifilaceae bacterium CYCD]
MQTETSDKPITKRIPKLLFAIALLSALTIKVIAQTDSLYIVKDDQSAILSTFLYENFIQFTTVDPKQSKKEIDYLSNNPVSIGLGFNHPKIPFEISFGYNLSPKADEEYLRTRSLDVQLHQYGRMYVTDISLQHYRGFYIDDSKLLSSEANCPDLSIFEIGISGQYIFNGHKFSYKSAFGQNEYQVKSAGSFLLGGGIYFYNINSDSSFTFDSKNRIKSYQFGANTGYSYNWVVSKHILLNGSLTLGANLGNSNIGKLFNKDLYITPMALVRSSCFYNYQQWYLGISFVVNVATLAYTENSGINLGYGRFYISLAKKFETQH